ncbi:transcriptional regulator [Photobacterium angustum]|uniref:PLP-dependent aminotransferase family protein n=1 Tax=Photobacterium angustum TaxID=661 RepID=A0ABX5GYW3_PHOAN|nr:PLP-dependent aminotransferase family protein [Photobacterium angustum]KJG34987.1 transcriptional regulator [Photobacterium angustum]PSX01839.1 PLP-dependent aminotransferase family protein [Photobacterium angustum]
MGTDVGNLVKLTNLIDQEKWERSSKYILVESYLLKIIQSGAFQDNDKLPSIRKLSADLCVSKNTVIRAYQELEAQGYVYALPKSGYRVSVRTKLDTMLMEPTCVDLLSLCKDILSYPEYKECLPLGSAHPNINAPAIKSLYAEIGRHSRQQVYTSSHYQLPPGNKLLVKQLAKITQDLGISASTDDLLVTHGAQQSISLALRAMTRSGDIVAVESPCYFGNLLLLESLGLKVIEIPSCSREGISPEALEQAMKTWDIKVIIVTPNFTNPTGAVMPLKRRQKLLSISSNIPIIEDDVFGALAHGTPLPSLYSLDIQKRVIYVNSLSKTLDSRLRIGWILAGKYREKIEKYLLCDNMGGLNLLHSGVATFLTSGKYRTHTSKMIRNYQSQVQYFCLLLNKVLSKYENVKNRYQIHKTQGSFLLWIRLPKGTDSYELYRECNQHKISILPGTVFGSHNQYKHCFRVSVANFDCDNDWLPAMEVFGRLISQHVN